MPDVAIWNQCNSHCVMCTNPSAFQSRGGSLPYSLAHIKRRWANRNIGFSDVICLTGGEPTIHPNFLEIIRWFREEYPGRTIAVATNGRMFASESFAKEILRLSNLVLEIAVHGADAKSHDSVTRTPGSFAQTVSGIRNILEHKHRTQELELRIILTRMTYKRIGDILSFLAGEFEISRVRDIALIFLELEGQARENLGIVGITYTEVRNHIAAAVRRWSSRLPEIRLFHFPLCTVPPGLWKYTWRTLREEESLFLPVCKGCLVRKYCLGVHRDYLEIIGSKEFGPVRNFRGKIRRNNSFYKPIKDVI